MTIYGWDLSHYDQVPRGSDVVSEGISFSTHKAGGDANDSELAAWWTSMKPVRDKVLLGAYWVLYPGSPTARADAFLARLDQQCPGWRDGPFILQADCEMWDGEADTIPSIAQINAFCARLLQQMPKLTPVGYLPEWVYPDVSAFKFPLWASSYVTGSGYASALYPGDDSSHWKAYGKTPSILQYSSNAVIAGQTTCDANAYKGTLAQLTALVAPGWTPEVTSPVDLTPAAVQAIVTALTTNVAFTDTGGGNHNPISTAVWDAKQIPDAKTGLRGSAWSHLSTLPTASDIAAAVVAALPPGSTGDLTADQIQAAVESGVYAVMVRVNTVLATMLEENPE